MATLEDYRPADYAVIGAAGLAAVFALFGAWFTIPWRRRSRTAKGTREFNPLWRGRAALELLCALWVLVQMLRLTSLWGASSVVFGGGVTAWTSSGWMCRAYLAASLGVLQPLCSLTTLLLIATAVSRKFGPDPQQRPAARVACLAVGLAAPVAAVQGLFAFMSLFLRYQGQPPEAQPRSALGIFFATYWRGDAQQCGGSGGGSGGGGGCAACTFPAASVIAHAAFTAAYVGALALLSSRTAAAALNQHLRRRVRVFQALESALAIAGERGAGGRGCVGASSGDGAARRSLQASGRPPAAESAAPATRNPRLPLPLP